MRFQVPQFTDVEDKIIGPLTFKQFIYLAGSAGIIVVLFAVFPRFIAIFFTIPVAIFGALLAFYKFNNQSFIKLVESYVKYTITSKLYLWKHEQKDVKASEKKAVDMSRVPKLSDSRLNDLMWSLDVKQKEDERQ